MGTENNKRSKRRDRETLLSTVAAHILCPQTRFSVPKPGSQLSLLWLRRSLLLLAATEWAKIWKLGRVPEQKWPWSEFEGEPKETKALLDGPKGA